MASVDVRSRLRPLKMVRAMCFFAFRLRFVQPMACVICFVCAHTREGKTATFKLKVQKGVVNIPMPLNRPTNNDGTIVLPTKLFLTCYIDDEEKETVLKSSNWYRVAFFNHLSAKFRVNFIPDGTTTYEAVPSVFTPQNFP